MICFNTVDFYQNRIGRENVDSRNNHLSHKVIHLLDKNIRTNFKRKTAHAELFLRTKTSPRLH